MSLQGSVARELTKQWRWCIPSTFTKKPPPYASERWTWAGVRPLFKPSSVEMILARSVWPDPSPSSRCQLLKTTVHRRSGGHEESGAGLTIDPKGFPRGIRLGRARPPVYIFCQEGSVELDHRVSDANIPQQRGCGGSAEASHGATGEGITDSTGTCVPRKPRRDRSAPAGSERRPGMH